MTLLILTSNTCLPRKIYISFLVISWHLSLISLRIRILNFRAISRFEVLWLSNIRCYWSLVNLGWPRIALPLVWSPFLSHKARIFESASSHLPISLDLLLFQPFLLFYNFVYFFLKEYFVISWIRFFGFRVLSEGSHIFDLKFVFFLIKFEQGVILFEKGFDHHGINWII